MSNVIFGKWNHNSGKGTSQQPQDYPINGSKSKLMFYVKLWTSCVYLFVYVMYVRNEIKKEEKNIFISVLLSIYYTRVSFY